MTRQGHGEVKCPTSQRVAILPSDSKTSCKSDRPPKSSTDHGASQVLLCGRLSKDTIESKAPEVVMEDIAMISP